MGILTSYLQQEFIQQSPSGWVCRCERSLLPKHLEDFLGYGSRVDVLLEREDGSRRLWIEFEVSRADPVANHAKFATAHLFEPQIKTDSFISMVSPHITRGRRNLAANTILLMRRIGMSAFQTVLFPQVLVLDDVLIGLDMSNRLPIIDVLQDEFKDYQIFLMTYDKEWYDILKRHFPSWKTIELYVGHGSDYEMPIIIENKTYLDKAKFYLLAYDHN